MIPAHKKKELIAFIEQLEDENVLTQLQELLTKAKAAALAPPAAPPISDNDPRLSGE